MLNGEHLFAFLSYSTAAAGGLGNGRHKLRQGKWLSQQDAIGDTFRRPIRTITAGYVDDGHRRVGFSRGARHIPPVKFTSQLNVGYDGPKLGLIIL